MLCAVHASGPTTACGCGHNTCQLCQDRRQARHTTSKQDIFTGVTKPRRPSTRRQTVQLRINAHQETNKATCVPPQNLQLVPKETPCRTRKNTNCLHNGTRSPKHSDPRLTSFLFGKHIFQNVCLQRPHPLVFDTRVPCVSLVHERSQRKPPAETHRC